MLRIYLLRLMVLNFNDTGRGADVSEDEASLLPFPKKVSLFFLSGSPVTPSWLLD